MSKEQIVYSWSRLNSYYSAMKGEGCLLGFDLAYNKGDRGSGNYFSEFGTLVHETTEKIHRNELSVWDIDDELRNGLSKFEFKAPFPAMKKSYEAALYDYFDNIDEVFADYTFLQAEEEKLFEIDGIKLKGFPDLIAQHKKAGMVIADYKTSKVYEGDKLKHNILQLYLYSIPFIEEYGYYPDSLIYIFPRVKGQKEYIYKFDLNELERAKQFVRDTVRAIESHTGEWYPLCNESLKDTFYPKFLCGHRLTCPHIKCLKK